MGWILLIIGLILLLGFKILRFIFDGILLLFPPTFANQIRNGIHIAAAILLLCGLLSLFF